MKREEFIKRIKDDFFSNVNTWEDFFSFCPEGSQEEDFLKAYVWDKFDILDAVKDYIEDSDTIDDLKKRFAEVENILSALGNLEGKNFWYTPSDGSLFGKLEPLTLDHLSSMKNAFIQFMQEVDSFQNGECCCDGECDPDDECECERDSLPLFESAEPCEVKAPVVEEVKEEPKVEPKVEEPAKEEPKGFKAPSISFGKFKGPGAAKKAPTI